VKIEHRERYFNSQCENLTSQHRAIARDHQAVTEQTRKANDAVAELTAQLAKESETLEGLKTQMDEFGSNLSDTTPLIKLRQSYKALKSEIRQMNLRTGVLQNSLVMARIADSERDHRQDPRRRRDEEVSEEDEGEEEDD